MDSQSDDRSLEPEPIRPTNNPESDLESTSLDNLQIALYDKLIRLILEPSDSDRQIDVTLAVRGLIGKFSHKVEQIIATSTNDSDRVTSIANLFIEVDQRNLKSCAGLSPCDARCHDATNWDDAQDMVQASFDHYDGAERMDLITGEFSVGIEDKLVHLSSHLTTEPINEPAEKRSTRRTYRNVGRRALGCREPWRQKTPNCIYNNPDWVVSDGE